MIHSYSITFYYIWYMYINVHIYDIIIIYIYTYQLLAQQTSWNGDADVSQLPELAKPQHLFGPRLWTWGLEPFGDFFFVHHFTYRRLVALHGRLPPWFNIVAGLWYFQKGVMFVPQRVGRKATTCYIARPNTSQSVEGCNVVILSKLVFVPIIMTWLVGVHIPACLCHYVARVWPVFAACSLWRPPKKQDVYIPEVPSIWSAEFSLLLDTWKQCLQCLQILQNKIKQANKKHAPNLPYISCSFRALIWHLAWLMPQVEDEVDLPEELCGDTLLTPIQFPKKLEAMQLFTCLLLG